MNIAMSLFSPIMHATKLFSYNWFCTIFNRAFHIVIVTLIVSGCAAERIQLPNFEEAARSDEEVTDPIDYPELCMLPWTAAECWQRIDVYEDVAEGNKKIAQLNADIARLSDEAYDRILSAAKAQQGITKIREEMLELERQDHLFDNIWHRSLIILLGIGLVL